MATNNDLNEVQQTNETPTTQIQSATETQGTRRYVAVFCLCLIITMVMMGFTGFHYSLVMRTRFSCSRGRFPCERYHARKTDASPHARALCLLRAPDRGHDWPGELHLFTSLYMRTV